MYLDAVINAEDPREVIYNSIPENVKRFLEGLTKEQKALVLVYDGKTLTRQTVQQYLNR